MYIWGHIVFVMMLLQFSTSRPQGLQGVWGFGGVFRVYIGFGLATDCTKRSKCNLLQTDAQTSLMDNSYCVWWREWDTCHVFLQAETRNRKTNLHLNPKTYKP